MTAFLLFKRAAAALAIVAIASVGAAQVPARKAVARTANTTFGWYAEFVSFDQTASAMTVKARIEPHVARYVSNFKPGERLVLTWSQFDGNADVITYATSAKTMTAKSGYLVRAAFVSADPKAGTVTFTVPVPATAAASVAVAKPGTPVRVGAPLAQPGPEAVITAVALNRPAPPRPAPVAKAAAVSNARPVAGNWAIESTLMGNPVKLQCAVTQDGGKLAGTCKGAGPIGAPPLTGSINGDDVVLQIEVTQGDFTIPLRHEGKLDAGGTAISGSIELMGNVTPFKAVKQ